MNPCDTLGSFLGQYWGCFLVKKSYLIAIQSREDCAHEGNEHGETCREEYDRILDEIRTERDSQLEVIRTQSVEDQLQVIADAKEELVIMQAQLEQQLKNIREQHYYEIEKIMRKCEGGAEQTCPAFDCSMCPGNLSDSSRSKNQKHFSDINTPNYFPASGHNHHASEVSSDTTTAGKY